MGFHKGEIVRSLNGGDKDKIFFLTEEKDGFAFLVDGKRRKMKSPKKKSVKHILSEGLWPHPVTDCLAKGDAVLDSEIRRALAAFRDKFGSSKEV